ncbi:MAG: GNAT family N-acetyltransferase [Anaerolineae bacterium]
MSEVWSQLKNYRKVKTLPSGARLLLRPLTTEDKDDLVDLFARGSEQDLEYFRSDARDSGVVQEWVEDLNYRRLFPLVAVVEDRIVGEAMLNFGKHFHRHVAWVRVFLDPDYRRQGIGTLMIRSLVEIGRRVGLHQLYAEIATTQPQVIKAFEDLGFHHEVTLRDYFMRDDTELLNMAIMVLPLVDHSGAF